MGQRRPAAGAGPAPPPGPPAPRHSPPYTSAHWQRGGPGPRRSSAGGTPSSASGASESARRRPAWEAPRSRAMRVPRHARQVAEARPSPRVTGSFKCKPGLICLFACPSACPPLDGLSEMPDSSLELRVQRQHR